MITVDDLHAVPLFKELPDDEAATVASRLADVRLRPGDWLLHEGEQPSFFMLLEGRLELFKIVDRDENGETFPVAREQNTLLAIRDPVQHVRKIVSSFGGRHCGIWMGGSCGFRLGILLAGRQSEAACRSRRVVRCSP